MTLRRVQLLLDRLEGQDRPRNGTIELMCAQLIAMVGNTSFRGFKQTLRPVDFILSRRYNVAAPVKVRRKSKKVREREFGEQLRKTMMSAFGDG